MWKFIENKNFENLKNCFEWVQAMENIPQDPIHHAEGNVAIHTEMVLNELLKLPDFDNLEPQSKEILWAAALLHDIEKRSTTVIDADGRVMAAGHAKKGAATAQQILYRSGTTPFSIREDIVGLVRHHGLPIWIFEKPNPQKMLIKASFEVNTTWVYLLAKADMLGRVCQDQADMLYRIELFRELCIENDCWGKPKVFASELSKFYYFRKEDQIIDYEVFDNTKAEAVLLVGVAGAGKDTYCNKYLKDHAVVSLDAMRREQNVDYGDSVGNGRIIQAGKELAKSYLRQQIPFVWNATNLTRQMRESLIDLFASYGAKVKIVYIEVPYRQLQAQNKNRQYAIPSNAIERMIDKLEVPKPWEAVSVLYVV